jgi:SAM-dependent methyltransferase
MSEERREAMQGSALPRRNHFDVMQELVPLAGAVTLDVGCGEGRITRLMAGAGARVTGIDPGPQQIARARAERNVAGEAYAVGSAEALDAASGSVDLVVFFNSLHHVPVAVMDRALAEAARVLRPGGRLYIAEPLAEGAQYELSRPVNDEAAIRDCAYDAISRAAAAGLKPVTETRYVADGRHASFEAWRDNSIAIDPERAPRFAAREAELRARFAALGEQRPDGWHFPQPVRVNLLRKAG